MSVLERMGARPPNPVVVSKLRNAARRSVTLLVESGFDQRFWWMYRHSNCEVVHQDQGGREAALRRLDEARGHTDAVLLAVLDADLDRMEGRLLVRDDVVWTDAHDLETTLLLLPTLEKILHRRIPPERLQDWENRWRERFRERLLRHGLEMGRLRWHVVRARPGALHFKKEGKGSKKGQILLFDRYDDCTEQDWTPSPRAALHALIAYNNAQPLLQALEATLSAISELPSTPVEQICNGHDLVGFLFAGIAHCGGERPASPDDLADRVAESCERAWLQETEMWRSILAWEAAHPGFHVLAAPP